MPVIASINSSNVSYTITDTTSGTNKTTYPLSRCTSNYQQSSTGEKTLTLLHDNISVVTISNNPNSLYAGNVIFGNLSPDAALIVVEASVGATKGGGVGVVSSSVIGDLKVGLQASDHFGWYKCDNRLVTSLPASIQTNFNSLGTGRINLPFASVGTGLIVGTLGANVGSKTIAQANLPNVNLTVSSTSAGTPAGTVSVITHSVTGGGFDPAPTSGVSNLQQTDRTPENVNTLGTTMGGGFSGATLPGHTHTVSLGGSGADFTPFSVGGNMFIYLGEAPIVP